MPSPPHGQQSERVPGAHLSIEGCKSAPEGHYIAAPLQEALFTLLGGPPAVAILARLTETLRAQPFDAPGPPHNPTPAPACSRAPAE